MERTMTSSTRWIAAVALAAALMALGCQDQEINAMAPDIAVTPVELDFGTVTLGTPAEQIVTLHNAGGGTLQVDSVTLLHGDAGFAVEAYQGTLAHDEYVDLVVSFDPLETGPADDFVLVQSDDPDESTVEVHVFAADVVDVPAPALAWSPSSLDFGLVPSGGVETLTVTLSSVGSLDLEILSVELDSGTSEDFTLTQFGAPATLPPGTSDVVDVTYTPSDDVPDSGTLVVTSNDPAAEVVEIPLLGELLVAPDIELVPPELLFGEVAVGATVTLPAEIWNLGDADLTLGTLALSGSTEFTLVVDPTGAVVAPGEWTPVEVAYTPVDETTDTGEVEIPSDDPDEDPVFLQLAGQFEPLPDIDVDPLTLDFGAVVPGTAVTEEVAVSNVGSGDLTVDLPVLTGSVEFFLGASQFPCVVAPGATELIMVTYTPVDLVADAGEITVTSDDPDEPTVVVELLADTTPTPDIDLAPTALQFGQVLVGGSQALQATVTNVGTADLTLGTLAVVGTSEYTLGVDPSGAVLAPGDSTPVEVIYAPVDMGADVAQVEIPSDDPDENPVWLDLEGEDEPVPDIDVDPLSLDFGQVDLGSASSDSIAVSNVGGADLQVGSISLSGSADFNWTSASLPGVIPPGVTALIYVTYGPTDDGADSGTLSIASDDADEPIVDVPVAGEATPYPDIDVDPVAVDFGDVVVDSTVTAEVVLSSVGTDDLQVYSCQYSGDANFWISVNPGNSTLAPGDAAVLEISFHPMDVVGYAGSVEVHSDDPDSSIIVVNVIGGGRSPDIYVWPTVLDFGAVPVGSSSNLDAVVLNMGGADLELGTLNLYGSSEFLLDVDPSGAILAPGDSTLITVTYAPVNTSADTATIDVPSNDPDEASVYLQLSGEFDPIADIDVSPTLVTFSSVDVGQTYTTSVSVTNVGTGDLDVDVPVLSGSYEFSLNTSNFPITLASGMTRSFNVLYTPTDLADDAGQVTIASDDPDEPTVVVDLEGLPTPAPDIDVLPTSLTYGQVLLGQSIPLTANITNAGTLDLHLDTLTVDGTAEYAITVDPSGATLPPGSSAVVEVTYTPTNAGPDLADLEIPSDDPDEPVVVVPLVGADEPVPEIEVDPLTVDFGGVDIGLTRSENVEVTNLGGATLTVSAVYLSGSGDFTYAAGSLPGTLAPGASRTISVVYTPSDALPDGGVLTVVSDDADEPVVDVDLSGQPADEPIIDVDPWVADFGDVKVNTLATETVLVYNQGGADLEIYSCTRSGDPNFWIETSPAGSTVPAGGSVPMEIGFSPSLEAVYSGTVDIASNDPYDPVVTVELLGAGAVPEIDVYPPYWDFLNVQVECEETEEIQIFSVGSAPLALNGYGFSSTPAGMTLEAADLDDHVNNGWELQPGDSITVTVSFVPTQVAGYQGELSINSDDPNLPIATVELDGDGIPAGYTQDNFLQEGSNAADVLWVVDNSCSMDDEQGYLADDFGTFYTIVGNAGVDYRIATVTTDDADFVGGTPVIDPYTPNGAATFATNCTVGTNGSGTERGLRYGYDALVLAYNNNNPNQGFWRQDAGLRVVYVSDEEDQSGSWSTYLSYYQGLKADPDQVVLSAICGTDGYNATSCSGPGGNANPGNGYVDVANATGGVLGSICDSDWSTVLTNLAWITVSLVDTFELSYDAIDGTITVYVNGVQQMIGWSFDANSNSVVFDPSYVPNDGDVVQINYGYYGAC
jgi:uncharacterized membrane protein